MSVFKSTFSRDDVELLKRERVFDGFFKLDRVHLRHRRFEGGWSEPLVRELFIRDDAVCVLPYDPISDCVLLIEQFRVGALLDERSPWLFELVAGIVEPGESVTDVAHREMEEEAGAKLLALEPICRCHVSPGGSQEAIQLFCGLIQSEGLGGLHGLAHEGEDIRATVMSRQEAHQALLDGVINNAGTIMALQWLALNHRRLREQWQPLLTDQAAV
ncbi:MAG: ADP-ribose pyrophosphatase [Motiliproteus sp.]|jgi:ADP-ribose pyrophosphatase